MKHLIRSVGRLCASLLLVCTTLAANATSPVDGETSTTLHSFAFRPSDVDAPTLEKPVAIAATWSATATGMAAGNWRVNVTLVPSGAGANRVDTQVIGRNCNAIAPCSEPMTLQCTYDAARRFNCGDPHSPMVPAGRYDVITQACFVKPAGMELLCDSQTSQLTLH